MAAAIIRCTRSLSIRRLHRLSGASKSTATAPLADNESAVPKPFSEMPADTGWPLLGSLELFRLVDGKVGKDSVYTRLYAKYGNVMKLKTPGSSSNWIVISFEPESSEAMFRAEGKYPVRNTLMEKAVTNIHNMNNWPSPMIFAIGEDWKRIRSAVSKQVVPRRVGNLTPVLCGVTDDLLNHIESISSSSECRIEDLADIMTKWAFQNTAYFVFGEDMDVYNTTDPTQTEFIEAGLDFIREFSRLQPLPIYDYFPSLAYRKFIRVAGRMRVLGKQIMERKVVALSEDIARGTVDETRAVGILEQWLIEGKLEPEDALTQACDLLSAGLDTTKNSTTFLLYELAKQPALQDQLCDEIKAVLGDKVNPSWEDLQNIPLIRYCLKETLRMYTPIQGNVRELNTETVISGYQVPAGTLVITGNDYMCQNEKYFDQPDKFLPERWSKNQEDSIHPFASLPFGFGQRGCYGRRLAELEIFILLTKLIPRFTLSTDKDSIAMVQETVLKPKEPVPITFSKRH